MTQNPDQLVDRLRRDLDDLTQGAELANPDRPAPRSPVRKGPRAPRSVVAGVVAVAAAVAVGVTVIVTRSPAPHTVAVTTRQPSSTVRHARVGLQPLVRPVSVITGTLEEVGGPAPGGATPVPGRVSFVMMDAHGPDYPVTVGSSGRFRVRVPSGLYAGAGSSPDFDGGRKRCAAVPHAIVARPGRSTHVDVVCQRR